MGPAKLFFCALEHVLGKYTAHCREEVKRGWGGRERRTASEEGSLPNVFNMPRSHKAIASSPLKRTISYLDVYFIVFLQP
jgi:hypothetical protein